MKKIIGAVLVGSMLLGGCSEEVVKEEPVRQKETTKAAEPAKKAEKPFESEYTKAMSVAMQNVSDALGGMTEESKKMADNPALILDQGWIMDMALALTMLDASIIQVRDIEQPTDPKLKEAHGLVLNAMDHYEYVVDNYPSAIDNMDADLIKECTENLKSATVYIQEANEIITNY